MRRYRIGSINKYGKLQGSIPVKKFKLEASEGSGLSLSVSGTGEPTYDHPGVLQHLMEKDEVRGIILYIDDEPDENENVS